MESQAVPHVSELFAGLPSNWGRWGADDEVGSLNFLSPEVVLRSMASVKKGKVFTLQVKMANPEGDPVWPGRSGAQRLMVIDKSHYLAAKASPAPGGQEYADDHLSCFLQGSTQYDALGHVWYDDQLYNGFDARTTIGGMAKAGVLPLAQHGIVGRGVLLDLAAYRGKDVLDPGETFDHHDLEACARAQGVGLEPHMILVIRTGWIGKYYRVPHEEFYSDFVEPGLTFSRELVEWFHRLEIPNLVTDTIANEVTVDPDSGVVLPLHGALMRNLGVTFTEIAWLEDLAIDCRADAQWDFLYAAAPLKVVNGTGSPVNPIAIK